MDVYLLDSVDPATTGSDLFHHGPEDTNHAFAGRHFEMSGADTSSITLAEPVDVTLTLDSGPALELLQSCYTGNPPNQPQIALRFNLDQDFGSLDGNALNRYILNNAVSGFAILSMPGTFADWVASYDLGAQIGPENDPDGDGIMNLIEAWYGTDPSQATAGLSALNTTGTTTTTFTHPRNPRAPTNLSAAYEWSPNLVDWYASSSGPEGGPTMASAPPPQATQRPSRPRQALRFPNCSFA